MKMEVSEWPDLDPQDGAIWPLGQVHILGLEQKPSPHELRQMAANEKMILGQRKYKAK